MPTLPPSPPPPTVQPKPVERAKEFPFILWHLLATGILTVLILLVYSNSFGSGFVLDNEGLIQNDPRLRAVNDENLAAIFKQDYAYPSQVSGLYRPLTTLSFLINYTFLGSADRPSGYHLINLLLHIGNAVLVYLLMLELIRWFWPSLATASLFAVHPLATEAVTNIAGRAELLAAGAVLGALHCHIRAARSRGWQKWAWLGGVFLITLIGLLCNESVIAVVGVIPMCDLLFRMGRQKSGYLAHLGSHLWQFFIKGYIAMLPAIGIVWLVRWRLGSVLAWQMDPVVDNPLLQVGWISSRMTAIKVMGMGLWRMFLPVGLSCDYSFNQISLMTWPYTGWEQVKGLLALAAVLILLIAAAVLLRRSRTLTFLILFFFITLLPTSNLIVRIGSIMSERFYYLPLAAFTGGLVIGIDALCRWIVPKLKVSINEEAVMPHHAAASLFIGIGLLFAGLTYARNLDWKNNLTLWGSAAEVSPGSYRVHRALAAALFMDRPDGQNVARCIEEGETAARIIEKLPLDQRDPLVYLQLGIYYGQSGDIASDRDISQQIQVNARSEVLYRRAVDVLEQGMTVDQAVSQSRVQRQIRMGRSEREIIDVGVPQIYERLAVYRERLKNIQGALDACRYLRRINPGNLQLYANLASLYRQIGQDDEAAVALIQILLLDKNHSEIYPVLQQIYEKLNHDSTPAIVEVDKQPQLNFNCYIVRQHLFAAHYDLVKLFLAAKRYDLAVVIRNAALQNRCAAEPIDELLVQAGVAKMVPTPTSQPTSAGVASVNAATTQSTTPPLLIRVDTTQPASTQPAAQP